MVLGNVFAVAAAAAALTRPQGDFARTFAFTFAVSLAALVATFPVHIFLFWRVNFLFVF